MKNLLEKALKRNAVFSWTKLLAIYLNINFREGHLFLEAITPKLIKEKKIQKIERILEDEIQK